MPVTDSLHPHQLAWLGLGHKRFPHLLQNPSLDEFMVHAQQVERAHCVALPPILRTHSMT